jgi:hypothetical protein
VEEVEDSFAGSFGASLRGPMRRSSLTITEVRLTKRLAA